MKSAFFTLIVLILTCTNVSAQVYKTVNVSTPGTLQYLITETEAKTVTVLTISGNIDTRDFAFIRDKMKVVSVVDLSLSSIRSHTGSDGTNSGISITYPANEIPMYAFYNPYLFTYKSSLTSIKLPSGTVSIGYLAFYYAWNLTGTVNFPSSVKSIADYAFYGCSSITAFSVASSNTRYSSSNGVLFNKAQDTLFLYPPAKVGIYNIPLTVKHIGASAFENCYNLTTVTLPSSLISVGSYAFSYCSGITGNLNLPSTLRKLDDGAFYGCWNLTGAVSFPASLTKLGEYCFFESNNISSFNVNSLNPAYASNNDVLYSKLLDTLFICPGGKTGPFTILSSVKLIGSHAFYNCNKLTGTIAIPQLVDYIGYYAFYGCSQLSGFNVDESNLYFTSENDVLMTKTKERLISCPISKSGDYQMPPTIREIDPAAFAYCANLTGVMYIPDEVKQIGSYAFYGCKLITGFEVGQANTKFSSSEGLVFNRNQDSLYICPLSKNGSYKIPATVCYIGYSAFDGCNLLTDIILPASLTAIDKYAFEYCSSLTKIRIPENVSQIGNGAFYNCTALQQFEIKRTVPPVVDYYTLDQINKTICKLVVPIGAAKDYMNTNYWNEFTQVSESDFMDTAIKSVKSNLRIYCKKQIIVAEGLTPGEKIEIYSMNGTLLKTSTATDYSWRLKVPVSGIYIIRISGKTFKMRL
ncbi:MAG: Chitin binding protein [Bacteroidetes bacterium]|nr:Chitin binding protein [Bacteroidota bacterium]